jgi:ferredoxin
MRVEADPGRCTGSGQCVLTAPAVFGQDDAGTVTVLEPVPPAQWRDAAREAEHVCPVAAITVRE